MIPSLKHTRAAFGVAAALLAAGGFSGCGPADPMPKDASPVVAADSEAAKQAIAQNEEMIRLRKEQEAKSRRKAFVSPEADPEAPTTEEHPKS